MTATRSEMFFTTARSWEMNSIERPYDPFHVTQQVEDLGLHRDVQRGDRLVADQQLRFAHQGAGDADPLALTAGELVRFAPVVLLGIEADRRPSSPASGSSVQP